MRNSERLRREESEILRSRLEELTLAREAAEYARDDLLVQVSALETKIADKRRELDAARTRISVDDALINRLRAAQ